MDVVSLRPQEDLLYNYNGYLALTHLLALPHIHFPLDDIRFSGRETGNQVSAYVQDGIQIGDRVTADVGRSPRSVRSCGVGDAPEPAGQRRGSGRPGGGRARVVQPLLRAPGHRRRVVEQRGPDGPDRGDRASTASAGAHDGAPVRARRVGTDRPVAAHADAATTARRTTRCTRPSGPTRASIRTRASIASVRTALKRKSSCRRWLATASPAISTTRLAESTSTIPSPEDS